MLAKFKTELFMQTYLIRCQIAKIQNIIPNTLQTLNIEH